MVTDVDAFLAEPGATEAMRQTLAQAAGVSVLAVVPFVAWFDVFLHERTFRHFNSVGFRRRVGIVNRWTLSLSLFLALKKEAKMHNFPRRHLHPADQPLRGQLRWCGHRGQRHRGGMTPAECSTHGLRGGLPGRFGGGGSGLGGWVNVDHLGRLFCIAFSEPLGFVEGIFSFFVAKDGASSFEPMKLS